MTPLGWSYVEWTAQFNVDHLTARELAELMTRLQNVDPKMLDKGLDMDTDHIALELRDDEIVLWLSQLTRDDIAPMLRIIAENRDRISLVEIFEHNCKHLEFVKFCKQIDSGLLEHMATSPLPCTAAWDAWLTKNNFGEYYKEVYGDE